ncbi:MAG: uroporphyrinogen decarboxylase family protein [Planctomycetota bacterium]
MHAQLQAPPDGVHALPPRSAWSSEARAYRDFYAMVPGAPLIRREFGLGYCIDAWREAGLPKQDLSELFMWDRNPRFGLGHLGWCEAAFHPVFEEKILEDRGEHELVQDFAGRQVLFFKGRRNGFMPEYLDHPVKDMTTWQRDVRWRLDPTSAGRFDYLPELIEKGQRAAATGAWIEQGLVGGYMYLRSLVGPEQLLYMFHDAPELVEDCMRAWFELSDAVMEEHQRHFSLDEIFLAEDICYNKGSLISPAMMRKHLFPWYRRLIDNAKARQLDQTRKIHLQVDTDGDCRPVIAVYNELGLDMMSPFEVASGCDVVAIAKQWPDLRMLGGMDKRVLSQSLADIDAMVERIIPAMRARGGYIPTIDHGVPPETPWQNYLHYRRRCVELGG